MSPNSIALYMMIKMREFINNLFTNTKIYQIISYRDRESKITQTGKDLRRQRVETTVKRLRREQVQQEQGLIWMCCSSHAALSEERRRHSNHTGALVESPFIHLLGRTLPETRSDESWRWVSGTVMRFMQNLKQKNCITLCFKHQLCKV